MSAWPISPEPFRIEPIFSPRIWGSRSLAPLFPDQSSLAEPIGEAWLTGVDCPIASGPFRGKTLGEAWREMPPEWRGSQLASFEHFPLLVKFIFPNQKLSIQVHPDDAYAAKHEQAAGGRGKTEMWHAVAAERNASVLVGLKPRTTKERFMAALEHKTLEELFVVHSVDAGDTMFIPAGTPHTIGPGLVLCEVQEYSDLTYRVYDYARLDASGKPRELHVAKALDVINFGPTTAGKTRPILLPANLCERWLLAACPYFAAELLQPTVFQSSTSGAHFELMVIFTGAGILDGSGFAASYRRGECWFLPANLGSFYVIPGAKFPSEGGRYQQIPGAEPTAFLRAYVPDLDALRKELQTEKNSVLAQTIFD